ncbi:hypothetical protein CYMTET_15593 [Cymbomonas tetramitiformis]|uniref:Uncharacterized protein n=1 Tax=Cymbomonas tetramitiformis TaxID=36881 RepID=A0AAE0GE98_9CHLO|nr:hypothetical protein CYMTET_15593 [Cymbomonas tetramitiformis]
MKEHAFATPVTDTGSPLPPGGGGGERITEQPSSNAVSGDRKLAYTTKPVGGGWRHSLVVPAEQSDPPTDVAAMTFVAPRPGPSPQLDHPPTAAAGGPITPAAAPHTADLALHPACTDFSWGSEDIAMLGFAEGDDEWPAFRETTWIPSPAIENPAPEQTVVEQD